MATYQFADDVLEGRCARYQQALDDVRERFGFDFASLGLAACPGAPLRWVYGSGAHGTRYRRIVLAPGHGIGGIVLKTSRAMIVRDVDAEIDPREYSTYPIVFAEDIRSFCAVPVMHCGVAAGALLLAYREPLGPDGPDGTAFTDALAWLEGTFCEFALVDDDFMNISSETAPHGALARNESTGMSALARALDAQEEERRRLSRELHDTLAQELLVISFSLARVESASSDSQTLEALGQMRTALDTVIMQVRNLSVELRPAALDHFGLQAALRSQAQVYRASYGTDITFVGTFGDKRLDRALETQVYRILSEALLNACKYSGSDEVTVHLDRDADTLHASVVDTGAGFDVDRPQVKGTGCGLGGMRERAGIIGGALSIDSSPRGTTVALTVPLSGKEQGL